MSEEILPVAAVRLSLDEYLSNNTSDFSDGTNGEPSAPGRTDGDTGTVVGLPDYKYLERQQKRHEKLKALLQRRDPDGIDEPIDINQQMVAMAAHMGLPVREALSPSMVRWFAGSKVVDERGYPLVVFHASPNSFRKFDTSKEGAHFGTYDQASNLRKAGKKEPKGFLLSIKNPLRMRDIGVWNNFNNLHNALSVGNLITDEQADAVWAAWQRTDVEGWEALKQALEQNGYDGIVYQNEQEGEGDSYIAFRPDQIKPTNRVNERLSSEEMAILKRQTRRPRRRVRLGEEVEDDDVKDVMPDPTPDYEHVAGQSFGWCLNFGTEQQIEERAAKFGLPLGKFRWGRINEDYLRAERNVLSFFNITEEYKFQDEGHSGDDLVGSGWVIPRSAPELWHLISSVPERQYIDLLDVGYLLGLKPETIYEGVSDFSKRLLRPMIYFFDIKNYRW